jgi:hypothetical protein
MRGSSSQLGICAAATFAFSRASNLATLRLCTMMQANKAVMEMRRKTPPSAADRNSVIALSEPDERGDAQPYGCACAGCKNDDGPDDNVRTLEPRFSLTASITSLTIPLIIIDTVDSATANPISAK